MSDIRYLNSVTSAFGGRDRGLYFYRLQVRSLDPAGGGTGSFVETKKMLVVK
jgi:hypothetical protein